MPDETRSARLTPREQAALEAVDLSYLTALLAELISFQSVGGHETPAQERVAAELRTLGLDVDEWEIDLESVRRDPDCSEEVARAEARGVVGHFGADGPQLMLNGHIDVVPIGDERRWTAPPWSATVTDGQIFGRGTADMKGGLACAIAAIRAVRTAGIKLHGSVSIASVVGEEDGGIGTLATLLRGHRADAAIVVEPTNGDVSPIQAGALGFRVTVSGAPAHGALRAEGVSAIEKFEIVHAALLDYERRRNEAFEDDAFSSYELPLALSIGTLQAGEWSSTVPDTLVAEGRYGIGPKESPQAARTGLEQVINRVARSDPWLTDHPPSLEWCGGQFHPATTDPDGSAVRALVDAHQTITGVAPPVTGVPYGSDLRHLVNRGGIPAVLYGPGDVRWAHREDEHVPIADLLRVTQTLALCVARLGTR